VNHSIGFFHRAAIPADILANAPQPNNWGTPTAYLGGTACDTNKFFYNHSIIFGELLLRRQQGMVLISTWIRHNVLWRLGWHKLYQFGVSRDVLRSYYRPHQLCSAFACPLAGILCMLLTRELFRQNASWTINSLQVYQSPQVHSGGVSNRQRPYRAIWNSLIMTATIFTFFHLFN
jgi:hypothetical protein